MISRAVRGLGDSDVVAASAVELSLDFTSQISNELGVTQLRELRLGMG